MTDTKSYIDLKGKQFDVARLDSEERTLVEELRQRAGEDADWFSFGNYWLKRVTSFYDARGCSRQQTLASIPYRVGQDLASRIGIAQGKMRAPDYREEIDAIIRSRYKSRRAFCEATGLSEDMLSHVLAGRKDLSIEALSKAMGRIGYVLRLLPLRAADNADSSVA
jgi:hypothetical protein